MNIPYYLIEERGYNISYITFEGTYEECKNKMIELLQEQNDEKDLPGWDQNLHNGNGDPFTYHLKSVEQYDKEMEEEANAVWDYLEEID